MMNRNRKKKVQFLEFQLDFQYGGTMWRAIVRSNATGGVILNPNSDKKQIALKNASAERVIEFLNSNNIPTHRLRTVVDMFCLAEEEEIDPLASPLGGEA